jgi:hypothetical protein
MKDDHDTIVCTEAIKILAQQFGQSDEYNRIIVEIVFEELLMELKKGKNYATKNE